MRTFGRVTAIPTILMLMMTPHALAHRRIWSGEAPSGIIRLNKSTVSDVKGSFGPLDLRAP
jgi:hypothetical protein